MDPDWTSIERDGSVLYWSEGNLGYWTSFPIDQAGLAPTTHPFAFISNVRSCPFPSGCLEEL